MLARRQSHRTTRPAKALENISWRWRAMRFASPKEDPLDITKPEDTTDSDDNEDSLTCAEFWPSPIAWARYHEADVPADSIDLWPTPMGWAVAK